MLCYECSLSDAEVQAIGMCRHCSAGLCAARAHVVHEPVTVIRRHQIYGSIKDTVTSPVSARRLLCGLCQRALRDRLDKDELASLY